MSEEHYNRWLILISAIIINICIGTLYAWSVFAMPLGKLFGWAPPALALVFTINHGLSPVAMIGGGYLQDKLGSKTTIIVGGLMFTIGLFLSGYVSQVGMLYLTYSALAGIGGGVIYAGNIGNTVKFFPDKRGLAAGLCAAGYGCGAMLVAPIASALIINYGVLNTFQILGTAFFIIIAICIMFIKKAPAGYKPAGWTPPVVAATAAQPAGNDSKWTQMISEGIWWVVMIMLFCGAMSGLMVLAHASPIGQIMFKLTPMNAAFFVSIITLANALGRVGFGALSDRIGRSNTIMIMYIVSALSMLNLAFTTSVAGFVASGIGCGAVFGGFMGTMPTIISDRYGLKNFGVNYGITFIGFSLAAIFGPLTAAKVRVATGNYEQAFWIALGINVVGFVFAYIFRTMDVKSKK
ncbi:L-lactate MFS transporter [Trichlorobacter lovleyi]|uniref:Major facilitator superfamily MFS_1 n=1 Tax=Trichlorobacter lovleyi (strain ATCC BAA-1151 / DSM 17278 / SZ) TaxID=398767 RepID=B3E5I8_TRIL1|nr:OFA family MFS transporter [Trichlorobacter lovleyi]ACD94659.1 major facilitator superfamily MFS_1 [Trichlorobacter lovleyi SZ]